MMFVVSFATNRAAARATHHFSTQRPQIQRANDVVSFVNLPVYPPGTGLRVAALGGLVVQSDMHMQILNFFNQLSHTTALNFVAR